MSIRQMRIHVEVYSWCKNLQSYIITHLGETPQVDLQIPESFMTTFRKREMNMPWLLPSAVEITLANWVLTNTFIELHANNTIKPLSKKLSSALCILLHIFLYRWVSIGGDVTHSQSSINRVFFFCLYISLDIGRCWLNKFQVLDIPCHSCLIEFHLNC